MLVHYKSPYGILYLHDGTRIYGACTRRRPTHVSWDIYRLYKQCFQDATYRSYDLEKIFPGRTFSPIAFKYKEVKYLPYDVLVRLGSEIGVLRPYRRKPRSLIQAIKSALKYGLSNCEYCGDEFPIRNTKNKFCKPKCQRKAERVPQTSWPTRRH